MAGASPAESSIISGVIARDRGIVRFEAEVLPRNKAMLRVFQASDLPMASHLEDGTVRVNLALGERLARKHQSTTGDRGICS